MDKQLINDFNHCIKEDFKSSDLKLEYIGNRSQVYSICGKFAIKVNNKDYKYEKEALQRLRKCSFVPIVYGFSDELRAIYMEWIDGIPLFNYIHSNNRIPKDFLEQYYEMTLQMYENLCQDFDDKLSEIILTKNGIKKVDYGQVEVCGAELREYYEKQIENKKQELQKLKNNDDDTWGMIEEKFLKEGVNSKILYSYREEFIKI